MSGLRLLPVLLAALLCGALASTADAHPHVWVTVETTVLHDHGAFVGLSYKWTFDQAYTAMAIDGLDKNKDGIYDREELAELAKVNIDGLKDFAFFTHAFLGGQKLGTGEAKDYWLEHTGGLLALHFTLPFASPVPTQAKGFAFTIHDPEFFVAFEPAAADPVKLGAGTPKECAVKVGEPEQKPGDGSALGELLGQLGVFGEGLKIVSVNCSGPWPPGVPIRDVVYELLSVCFLLRHGSSRVARAGASLLLSTSIPSECPLYACPACCVCRPPAAPAGERRLGPRRPRGRLGQDAGR